MAFKVRFTLTRPDTSVDFGTSLTLQSSDAGLIAGFLSESNGTVEYSRTDDGLINYTTYTFENSAAWQAFYNKALPVWTRNNLVEKANNSSMTLEVTVVENI